MSEIVRSEVNRKIKQLEAEGEGEARAPVPHSWRRQCRAHVFGRHAKLA